MGNVRKREYRIERNVEYQSRTPKQTATPSLSVTTLRPILSWKVWGRPEGDRPEGTRGATWEGTEGDPGGDRWRPEGDLGGDPRATGGHPRATRG